MPIVAVPVAGPDRGGSGRRGRAAAVGSPREIGNMDESAARDVVITREPVELHKVLKFEGLVGSGGEAKGVIDDGAVSVNGSVERRRRRKLVGGDVVAFAGCTLRLAYVPPAEDATA